MNDDNTATPAARYSRNPEPEQAKQFSAHAEDAATAGTPEAVKEAATRGAAKEKLSKVRGRGVDWVRPTDLMTRGGGALSRRGIDWTAAGGQRLRAPLTASARWVGERARRLPPLSAFGRRGGPDQGPVRSGVGMQ